MSSDQALMQRICDGDHAAFALLVQRHTDRFYLLAFRTLNNRDDAEDVVQNSFIKLWQKPTAWNASKSQFTTWFYRVILNACRDLQRKQSRQSNLDPATLDTLLPVESSEQQRYEELENEQTRQSHLRLAMTRLPVSQLDALNLVIYCSLPQREAAQVLGVSVKALESLLSRAKKNLVDQLAPEKGKSHALGA